MTTLIALVLSGMLAVQPPERPPSPAFTPVPFGPGERAEYSITLGLLGEVGRGSMEVLGIETVHGHPTYHLQFTMKGRAGPARVDNLLESWMDVDQLFARRIHKNQHEMRYRRDRVWEFFPDQMIYRLEETGETGPLASPVPLDEVAFLYFVRTIPLEVGQTYTFDRYYKESGNPVRLEVLRREVLKGLGGDVPVLVVRPVIRTSGLFGEGGEAEVYITDDSRRLLVRITSRVPVIGRLGLTITNYVPGQPLTEAEIRRLAGPTAGP
jgi:hypothetical protein